VAGDELFPDDEAATVGQQSLGLAADDYSTGRWPDPAERAQQSEQIARVSSLTATPCRVCSVGRVATLAPAMLCADCLRDLDATRAHVDGVYEAAHRVAADAEAVWNSLLDAAPTDVQARWERASAILSAGPASDAFRRTWQAEIAAQSALGRILAAHDALTAAEAHYATIVGWRNAAEVEINAANAA
jgi:hypothetical protein